MNGNLILLAPVLALPMLAPALTSGSEPTVKAKLVVAGEGSRDGRLVRVLGTDDPTEAFDSERWQTALQIEDLDQRERNFNELVELARRDPAVRQQLDAWAAGNDDLAWTARLALREVRPVAAAFQLKPFSHQGLETRFGDLHERLRELETMFEDAGRGYGLWVENDFDLMPMPQGGATRQEAKSYQIEIGPDGARVKVKENVDGQESTEEYKGESLEELFEANPELRERIQVKTGGADLWRDPFDNLRRRGLLPDESLLPRTDMLGIEFEQPTPALAKRLDLEPGVGLVVLRTVPGTIANILGIKRNDVLIRLNDNELYNGDDVSRVLRERQPEADVAVTLVDARGQQRTLTWHPSDTKIVPKVEVKTLERR